MADLVPITEDSLRSAMRDPRYWRSGDPERQAYVDWVSGGFRALYGEGSQARGGTVWVKPYTRTRDGMATSRTSPAIGDRRRPAMVASPVRGAAATRAMAISSSPPSAQTRPGSSRRSRKAGWLVPAEEEDAQVVVQTRAQAAGAHLDRCRPTWRKSCARSTRDPHHTAIPRCGTDRAGLLSGKPISSGSSHPARHVPVANPGRRSARHAADTWSRCGKATAGRRSRSVTRAA